MVQILKKYIVTTSLKSGSTNKLCYCRACFNKLGENHPELKTIVDKTDRILRHFKTCQNFQELYSEQEKKEVFKSDKQENSTLGKRSSKFFSFGWRSKSFRRYISRTTGPILVIFDLFESPLIGLYFIQISYKKDRWMQRYCVLKFGHAKFVILLKLSSLRILFNVFFNRK